MLSSSVWEKTSRRAVTDPFHRWVDQDKTYAYPEPGMRTGRGCGGVLSEVSGRVRLVLPYFQGASLPEACLLDGWDPAGMGVTLKLKWRKERIVSYLQGANSEFGSLLM